MLEYQARNNVHHQMSLAHIQEDLQQLKQDMRVIPGLQAQISGNLDRMNANSMNMEDTFGQLSFSCKLEIDHTKEDLQNLTHLFGESIPDILERLSALKDASQNQP